MSYAEKETAEDVPMEQVFEKFFGPSAVPVGFSFSGLSHVGNVRKENQDHFLVTRRRKERTVLGSNLPGSFLEPYQDDAYVMVVADGMGGQAFGELASLLALRVGMSLGTSEIKWSSKIDENESHEVIEKIKAFLKLMDREIVNQSSKHADLYGMGTTLTVVYTSGRHAFVGHVGDSRAYLFRGGELHLLTKDHTLANQLVEMGEITEDDSHFRRTRNVLTNCLGGSHAGVEVDTLHFELFDGDRLVLCSDGLTDMVSDEGIAQIMTAHPKCEPCTQALVDLALKNGGKDNVTVITSGYSIPDEAL